MKYIISLFCIIFMLNISAQDKYWLTYTDKNASKYSLNKPEDFMSEKALARRKKFNLKIDNTDLPVCKEYLSVIENIGVEINSSSKWLNGSVVIINDKNLILEMEKLPFIKNIIKLTTSNKKTIKDKFNLQIRDIDLNTLENDFGASKNQIQMLAGDSLHAMSFRGEGIDIAVMDNGFPGIDTNKYFQKAFLDGRIKKGYDFVNDNDTLFDGGNGTHGTYVISTMVSDVEGEIVGTAPDATYYVFSTEDNANEGFAEEINWAMAAEMADSTLGTNAIISTSLGYSNGFNNGTDYTYEDMDGNTTIITKAADLAAKKGFLVINSAGNSGANAWHHITAPSDGDSVLCIGAVNKDGEIVNFSSRGPSSDGRLKPNVCAQGKDAAGVSVDEKLVYISGTSFSCPITSGMAACLWQAFPHRSNMEIFKAIEVSSHLYYTPNYDYGYGIPNFQLAYTLLKRQDLANEEIIIMPNPISDRLNFIFKYETDENFHINIISSNGKHIRTKAFQKDNFFHFYSVNDLANLPKGVYYVNLILDKNTIKSKFQKN